MLLTKRLAYAHGGNEANKEIAKPKKIKHLFFTAAAVAVASLIYCGQGHAAPASMPASVNPDPLRWARLTGREQDETCNVDASRALENGEIVLDRVCTNLYEFVRTDRNMLIFPKKTDSTTDGGVTIALSHMSIGIGNLARKGIVDWDAIDTKFFMLLKNNRLVVVPLERKGEDVPTYDLDFNTSGMDKDRMICFAGVLLMASPEGSIWILKDAGWTAAPSGIPDKDAGFRISGNRLFFGTPGNEVEIKIGKKDRIVRP